MLWTLAGGSTMNEIGLAMALDVLYRLSILGATLLMLVFCLKAITALAAPNPETPSKPTESTASITWNRKRIGAALVLFGVPLATLVGSIALSYKLPFDPSGVVHVIPSCSPGPAQRAAGRKLLGNNASEEDRKLFQQWLTSCPSP